MRLRKGEIESATSTYANDVTADVMMIDYMLREPEIPIGSWIDRSTVNTPNSFSGRVGSDRAMLYNL